MNSQCGEVNRGDNVCCNDKTKNKDNKLSVIISNTSHCHTGVLRSTDIGTRHGDKAISEKEP